nr:putative ribonuclease H-like domain-containing protein [Tanacetum cinerariifolium]
APVVSAAQGMQGKWDKGVIDSGCSRHMTGNMSYLFDFKKLNGGYVSFGGNPKGGKISGKGKIKISKLDFDDVYFVKELKFNIFSVSQMCDKKNSVLFTYTECLVLSPDFKLPDDSQVLLRVPRKNNMELKGNSVYQEPLSKMALLREKNRALIEAARTMLADSLLPIPFWAEVVNTTCYVQNRVLVTKPHNKTPYELLHGRPLSISFMRLFSCLVIILNTLDSLGKFEGKVDEGFLVRYSVTSKTFRVFNSRTCVVQETLHVNFLENKPNIAGSGPTWLFYIDSLIRTMNYQPVTTGNQTNPSAGFQDKFDAEKVREEFDQQYVVFHVWSSGSTNPQNYDRDAAFEGKEHDFDAKKPESKVNVSPSRYRDLRAEFKDCSDNSINEVNAAGTIVPTVGQNSPNSTNTFSAAGPSNDASSPTYGKSSFIDASQLPNDPDMPELEDITYSDDKDNVGAEADFNNLETSITVRGTQEGTLALKDLSWIEAMQEELLQFKMQKDERGIVVRNKARLVAQRQTKEEGIDYEEVFAPVARIEAIRLFLAYASFMGFMVYQIDVKSTFIYGTIEEEVYVCQPSGFEDPDHPEKVYKVVKALYGLHQDPRAWYETLANYLLENSFQRGKIDQTLFIKKQKGYILLVQIYVDDFIFGETNKDLCKSFEKLMKDKFQMSSMGELTFFVVKRIFRHLKGKPHLGLWYPKDSPFDLVAYSDSDYAGASLDRKSTTGGCQFLGCRLISWQCKKQTVVAISSTRAEYVAAASCCAQVLWIQNQLLDYGDSPLLGVNTPRSDEDRLELMELTVFLLPKVEKVEFGVNAVDLQIIDFLNGCSIKYALTVNPNIYVSCIKQFWSTVVVKRVNDVTRLQALVDKKKVVVTEAAIREVLHLDDAEGVDCLPNEEIFTELDRIGFEKPSTKLTFYKAFFSSQWKFLIHTILQCMSAKRTSWNEFSSSMASAVICLSTGRKFNFSKYIFYSLVRNVDSTTKFYMYPHFLQLIIKKQVGGLLNHTTKYASPALTQKVFANIRRVGKGFSGVDTPLFEGMLVEQEIEEEGDADEHVDEVTAGDDAHGDASAAHGEVPTVTQEPSIQSPTPPTPPPQPPQDLPSTSQVQPTPLQSSQVQPLAPPPQPQPQQAADFPTKVDTSDDTVMDDASNLGRMIAKIDKDDDVVLMDDKEEDKKVEEAKVDKTAQVQRRQAESQAEIYNIDMDHANKVLSMQEDETEPAEPQVPVATPTAAPTRVAAALSRRRKGVVIRDPEEESTTSTIIPAKTKSKDKGKGILVEEPKPLKKKQQIEMDEQYARKLHAELNKDIDWDVAIDHVKLKAKEDPSIKRYQAMKIKLQTEAQARKNMMMYLKNVAGFKLDYFKGMFYDDIRPIFEAKFKSNVDFLLKTKKQMEEEENRALQTINETLAEKAAKRRKLNEEVEDLKRHLQIVHNEDDDVYTEATPLARKVPVVDYEIIELNNKPYYKIIRADGTHQLYISF